VSDFKLMIVGAGALTGLAYCLWKTQSDWKSGGFTLRVIWGALASLSAFFFVAFLFAGSVLKHL
jgi:hypothetical protein